MSTTIEWTQRPGTKGETWNPFAAFDKETGKRGWICQKVSPGCANCYAETFNNFRGNGHPYRVGELAKVDIRLVNLDQPLRWRHSRTVFVCSMTDLFLDAHTDDQIDAVFAVMAACWAKDSGHTFLILTKRPERAREYLSRLYSLEGRDQLAKDACRHFENADSIHDFVYFELEKAGSLPNVWIGTSIEDQQRADERIPHLLATPAAIRFLSCEPLLGPIDLWSPRYKLPAVGHGSAFAWGEGVDWVIIGGESGPGARPCNVQWMRDIIRDSKDSAAVFVKQLGAQPGFTLEDEDRRGNIMPSYHHYDADSKLYIKRLDDRKGGDMSQWPEDLRVREWPQVEVTA